MEVSGHKKSISLNISPLFFHIFSKLVQALIMTYNETFETLMVEGDILFRKPFLDPTHKPTIQP
jgi:hypothetical protein